jgi:hypothetical protein
MRTLFTSVQSKKAALRRLSAAALVGAAIIGAPVAALAEANGSAGGPAGGAFMSSYGPRGNWAKEPYPFQVSPSAVYPSAAYSRYRAAPDRYSRYVR